MARSSSRAAPLFRLRPDFRLESALRKAGARLICGVDEVGRGPLAGPVIAAAVILSPEHDWSGLDDSKRVKPAQRTLLSALIKEKAVAYAVASASPEEIDTINIRQASLLAMARAAQALALPLDALLVDGRDLSPALRALAPCTRSLIRGDSKSASIAAASIVAKVHRDVLMEQLAARYPGYGWERNRGYPTAEHRQALERLGPTPEHRRCYRPVRLAIERQQAASESKTR